MSNHSTPRRVVYKPIPGFPGYYACSGGKIWSARKRVGRKSRRGCDFILTRKKKAMKLGRDKDGYLTVRIARDKKKYFFRVSRLVLTTFKGPCPPWLECRHLDGVKHNDAPSNLCWGTSSQNQEDRRRHNTLPMGEKHHRSVLTNALVLEIISPDNFHTSNAEFSRKLKVTTQAIWSVRAGITWSHVTGLKNPRKQPTKISQKSDK